MQKVGTLIAEWGGKDPEPLVRARFCDWGLPLFSFTYFHTAKSLNRYSVYARNSTNTYSLLTSMTISPNFWSSSLHFTRANSWESA
jgi:hypothetical protein